MLPYLGAVGMVSSSVAPGPVRRRSRRECCCYVSARAGPGMRLGAGSRVEGPLTRAADSFDRKSGSALGWVMVVGFSVASDSVTASHHTDRLGGSGARWRRRER